MLPAITLLFSPKLSIVVQVQRHRIQHPLGLNIFLKLLLRIRAVRAMRFDQRDDLRLSALQERLLRKDDTECFEVFLLLFGVLGYLGRAMAHHGLRLHLCHPLNVRDVWRYLCHGEFRAQGLSPLLELPQNLGPGIPR